MSRIKRKFAQLGEHKALIPFITAGDPGPEQTVPLMHELVEAGADIIELGVPFSDPMADGPVIQAADERALEKNVSLHDVIEMVEQFRQRDDNTPVVLMGYLNPIEIMGYDDFAQQAQAAGVDGVLVVDMPPEEGEAFNKQMAGHDINTIFLVSPTTDRERIEIINKAASGYLYYVSLKGVTGANTLDVDSVANKLEEIRSVTSLPVGVGFGIKDGATAQAVARIADAVVVGSALVKRIEDNVDDESGMHAQVRGLINEMRQMMDQATVTNG